MLFPQILCQKCSCFISFEISLHNFVIKLMKKVKFNHFRTKSESNLKRIVGNEKNRKKYDEELNQTYHFKAGSRKAVGEFDIVNKKNEAIIIASEISTLESWYIQKKFERNRVCIIIVIKMEKRKSKILLN